MLSLWGFHHLFLPGNKKHHSSDPPTLSQVQLPQWLQQLLGASEGTISSMYFGVTFDKHICASGTKTLTIIAATDLEVNEASCHHLTVLLCCVAIFSFQLNVFTCIRWN